MTVKVLHVVGARPQFPKAAAVSRAMAQHVGRGNEIEERLLHTGQHYDYELSAVFFSELNLRPPDYNLGVGSGSLGYQTGTGLRLIGETLTEWQPDRVIVYGDTNATLVGAIAAKQRHVALAHVEAGVRTGNLHQAEELNRVVSDRISDWRLCCTALNMSNLKAEGLDHHSHLTGDTMLDNYLFCLPRMDKSILAELELPTEGYILCTVHRAENTDYALRLDKIIDTVIAAQKEIAPVVFPLHPRTREAALKLKRLDDLAEAGVKLIKPQGFYAMQALLEHCQLVFSDSGGVLREAYFAGRYCVIPWEYAGWPEIVAADWADTGSVEQEEMLARLLAAPGPRQRPTKGLFGDGQAGVRIAGIILDEDVSQQIRTGVAL